SFRHGSTVTHDLLDTDRFNVMGFAGSGGNMALWGMSPPGRRPTEIAIFTPSGSGSWRATHYRPTGNISLVQAGGFQTLACDKQGQSCVTLTEVRGSGQDRRLLLATAGSGSDLTIACIVEGVGEPRHSALAFGPADEIAIYSGNNQPGQSGTPSETIV